jgi:hypothetical protein
MALVLDSGEIVTIAKNATIDSLPQCSWLCWLLWDVLTADSEVLGKGTGSPRKQIVLAGTTALRAEVRTTTGTFIANADFTSFTPNIDNINWFCIGASWDVTGTNAIKLYSGDLVTPMTEPSSYVTQVGTAGTISDDSAADLRLGLGEGVGAGFDGKMAVFGMWNRVLTLKEFQRQQFCQDNPVIAGCVDFLNLEPINLGGQGLQRDSSGNNNHGTPAVGVGFFAHPAIPTCASRVGRT